MVMDYHAELKRIKKHRDKYIPVLDSMHLLYLNTPEKELPVDLTDHKNVLIILELIDIGYLNNEAFFIKKPFGTVEQVLYTGSGPLTQTGFFMLKSEKLKTLKKTILFIITAVMILSIIIAVIFSFFNR